MNIRLAKKNDIPMLVRFNQAMALETEGKYLDTEILQNGVKAVFEDKNKGFYVVAEKNQQIVGGLMITFEWSDWRNSWFWWIQSVYVLPDFRGQGVYRMLYDFVKKLAGKKDKIGGFRLYVEKENFRAQKVYEKLGMTQTAYLMFEEISKK
jgi:ribosomal protein S18 acetylase RimI-like enzyme